MLLAAVLGLLAVHTGVRAQVADTHGASPLSAPRFSPLEVHVNGVSTGTWVLLRLGDRLYVTHDALQAWRIEQGTEAAGMAYRDQIWYPLDALPGFELRFNPAEQSVNLHLAPEAFAATRLTQPGVSAPPMSPVEPAVFLNIDATLSRSSWQGSRPSMDLGALTELGLSTGWGVLTSSQALRPSSLTRLETRFERHFPAHKLTLRLGDTQSQGGYWGHSVYFGGVQLSRNFALSPGFIRQPVPTLSGTSSSPSTVSLYVDGVLRQSAQVPPGPFTIDQQALLIGAGQARVVVRDLLGRETVFEQPFFTHPSLLAPGLSDWSLELGKLRRDLGAQSGRYGSLFASGLWQHGISPGFTLEAQGSLARARSNLGLGASLALPAQTIGLAAWRMSRDRQWGGGQAWMLGWETQHPRHGISLRALGTDGRFRELGDERLGAGRRSELSLGYSHRGSVAKPFSLGLTHIQDGNGARTTAVSASHGMRIGRQGFLSISLNRVLSGTSGLFVGLSFSMPLGEQRHWFSGVNGRSGRIDAYSTISQDRLADTGLGWRLLAGQRQEGAYTEAGVYRQGDRWLLSADASQSSHHQSTRLGARGALVWMDGSLFGARYIQDSFALVEVPGYAGVGVGLIGQAPIRTNSDGKVLLPRLQAWQKNLIRLDPTDLPISAEIDDIEQTAVPAWRSGVKVRFPVRSGHAALLRVLFDDGEPAPAGATIRFKEDNKLFYVARRGEAFVTGLGHQQTLELHWQGQRCDLPVSLKPSAVDEIPRLAPITCEGVKR